jgi:NADH:ubiquinone oxidoreductase subunit 3 (subunit A)
VFYKAAMTGQPVEMAGEVFDKTFLLLSMAVFVTLLVIGFVYEWGKGAFKWT